MIIGYTLTIPSIGINAL